MFFLKLPEKEMESFRSKFKKKSEEQFSTAVFCIVTFCNTFIFLCICDFKKSQSILFMMKKNICSYFLSQKRMQPCLLQIIFSKAPFFLKWKEHELQILWKDPKLHNAFSR